MIDAFFQDVPLDTEIMDAFFSIGISVFAGCPEQDRGIMMSTAINSFRCFFDSALEADFYRVSAAIHSLRGSLIVL